MKPTIGRTVIVKAPQVGPEPAAAIIVAVHSTQYVDTIDSPACISVIAFPSSGGYGNVTSVMLYDTSSEAAAQSPDFCAWWPDRV